MRRLTLILAAAALLASGCSGDDPETGGPDEPSTSTRTGDDGREELVVEIDGTELVLTAGLNAFDACDSLIDHLRTEYAARVGPWGFNDGGWYGPVFFEGDVAVDDMARDGDDDGADAAAPTAQESNAELTEGVDFSGTNVQETGVDEADIVKTDGTLIYVVANGELTVVDVATRAVLGSVDVHDGGRSELFLDGNDVLYITQAWIDGGAVPATSDTDDEIASIAPFPYGSGAVIVQRITVADNNSPAVLDTLQIEGDYVSARAVDGTARIVVRSHPERNFAFVYPQNENGEDIALEANRRAVLDSKLEDWLPGYARLDANGSTTETGMLPGCTDVHAPTTFSGFGVTTVLSVGLGEDLDPSTATAVLAPGDTVYASTGSLYLSTTTWIDHTAFDDEDWEEAWRNRRVNIHRFDISAPQAVYTASGSVPGEIRNQFSLSEHDGHLRVVTTTGDVWGEQTSESHVRVLRETDGNLVEVGSVGNIGKGEAVQSVRFLGDIAYVVTFRQIDPFYTVDLSNPENPVVRGELKIPGFSSYLHPVGEGLVLGVGSDATDEGEVTGAKVSLFDVSDLDNPAEIAVWTVPDGWNDIGWEHRSFLWWGPQNLAVIPVQVWNDNWSGAVVLRVADNTITEVGRIDHVESGQQTGTTPCRQLGPDDLPNGSNDQAFESELEYMIAEDYGSVILCEQGESGMAGFDCHPEQWLLDEAERIGFDVAAGETINICYPSHQLDVIIRSLVIGDELWTLSYPGGWYNPEQSGRLQVNSLDSLERLGAVAL